MTALLPSGASLDAPGTANAGRRRAGGSLRAVLRRPLAPVGELFAFALEVLWAMTQRPFQWRELSDQAWFEIGRAHV